MVPVRRTVRRTPADGGPAGLAVLPGCPAHRPGALLHLDRRHAGPGRGRCVLAYGFHDLQEAGFLPGLGDKAFDISETIPPASWYGTLLKGVFDFQPDPTVLQVAVWALYLIPALALFFWPGRTAPAPTPLREKV